MENGTKLLTGELPTLKLSTTALAVSALLTGVFVRRVTKDLMQALEKYRNFTRERERGGRGGEKEKKAQTNKKKKSQNSTLCHPPLQSFLVYEQYSLKAPYESNPTTKKAQSIQICTILVSRYLKAVVPANSF